MGSQFSRKAQEMIRRGKVLGEMRQDWIDNVARQALKRVETWEWRMGWVVEKALEHPSYAYMADEMPHLVAMSINKVRGRKGREFRDKCDRRMNVGEKHLLQQAREREREHVKVKLDQDQIDGLNALRQAGPDGRVDPESGASTVLDTPEKVMKFDPTIQMLKKLGV